MKDEDGLWPKLVSIPASDFEALNNATHSLFIIIRVLITENGGKYAAALEEYYPVGTPENDLFQIMFHHWEGWPYTIITIPLRDRGRAEAVAEKMGMRLADGYPIMLKPPTGNKVFMMNVRAEKVGNLGTILARFPLNSRRVFTLENNHDRAGRVPGLGVPVAAAFLDNDNQGPVSADQFRDWLERARKPKA